MEGFINSDYLSILPEIALVLLLFVVLGYGSFSRNPNGRTSGLIAAWGTFLTAIFTVVLSIVNWGNITLRRELLVLEATGIEPATILEFPPLFWGQMIVNDPVGIVFRVMFLLALFFTILFSLDSKHLQRPEYFALLIAATIGFNLMAVSVDMIMILVSLETASISLYLLAGFVTRDDRSSEAGIKYFVYGAFASALMLYGMSLLFGFTGATNIYEISALVSRVNAALPAEAVSASSGVLLVSAMLLIAGFGFKISAVPFHWWAPDVYEGAPVPVTGFASTASKAAGFAIFLRVFLAGTVGSPSVSNAWWSAVVAICIITMLLGNLLAIFQSNIKRMLAYSSVAQAGYVLIGLATLTEDGSGAAMYYLLIYVITNLAAFGIIAIVANANESDDMTALYGLSRRSPWLAISMMLAILSLGGIPPTAGFVGKFLLFRAAVEAGFWWLALIGILLAFVSLYYYLGIIKYIYLYRDENLEREVMPLSLSGSAKLALGLTSFGILFLGIIVSPAFTWTRDAAQWLFTGL